MTRSFPLTEVQLTAVVLGYKNSEMVQDILAPRISVTSERFDWHEYPTNREFNAPDSAIGNRGEVNRVTSSFVKKIDSVVDWALEEAISNTDLDEAPAGVDLRANELTSLMHWLAMGREKRVADIYSNASNYGTSSATGNGDKWTADGADLYNQINDMLEKPLMRPNKLVLNQKNYGLMRNHKSIKAALGGFAGVASKQQIADLFEVDEVVVVKTRQNSAKKGKTPTIVNMWGENVSGVYISPSASLKDGATFVVTASREKGQSNYEENRNGAKGAYIIKAFDRCKELLIGKDCGSIITAVS